MLIHFFIYIVPVEHLILLYYFILYSISLVFLSKTFNKYRFDLSILNISLKGIYSLLFLIFFSELLLIYTSFYLWENEKVFKLVIGFVIYIKHLLGFYSLYLGLTLRFRFKKQKAILIPIITILLLILVTSQILPERVPVDGYIVLTIWGKIMVVVSVTILLIGTSLLYKFRQDLLKEVPLFSSIKLVIIFYLLVDIVNSAYILLNPVYKVDYIGNPIILLKVLLLPLVFLYICYKSLDLFRKSSTLSIPDLYNLTPREGEVLELILAGHSNQEIEKRLYIAKSTLKTHINRIFSKTQVGNRLELIFKFNN